MFNRIGNRMIASALVLAAGVFGSAAHAATMGSVQGSVLVNKGAGYGPAKGSSELKPGDTVMAKAGGSAQISYDDGCVVEVKVGQVVTVAQESPCKPTGAAGLAPTPGVGVGLAVAGVAGVAVVAGVAISQNRNNDRRPASP